MTKEEELIECAKKIREYCGNCTITECFADKCIFGRTDKKCNLEYEPVNWKLKGDNNDI